MNDPVIAVDVSKGRCHFQAFLDRDRPLRKPRILKDDKEDLSQILDVIDEIKRKLKEDIVYVIFEATGVYHRCLQKFLDDHDIPYIIIPPLLSANYRKLKIHGNKTDPLDCANLAAVYYACNDLRPYDHDLKVYEDLRKLSRYYDSELIELKRLKVRFRALLDIIYPLIDRSFKAGNTIYDPTYLMILEHYPHPSLLLKHKEATIINRLTNMIDHSETFIAKTVKIFYNTATKVYPGVDKDDIEVEELKDIVLKIKAKIKGCDDILKRMIDLAKTLPHYYAIVSIVGIGENLAARIIAEIGDARRYDDREALVAYAGLNPCIRQSGDIDGIHLSISKKGNRRLRCLLYLGASCNYRLKKNDPLYLFNQKKRQQVDHPLRPKAANIATARKLLNIIYSLSKSGEVYNF